MEPVLDPSAVEEALGALGQAEPLPPQHPLYSFVLMRQRLQQPEHPAGDYGRLYAAYEVLESCFLAVLGENRREAADQLACLRDDFRSDNEHRQTYSLLYYRYMRPELGLSVDQISSEVGFGDRTLRRRQELGLNYLTQDLIGREKQARRQQQDEILRARLPFPADRSLYGREWLVERACESLTARIPVLLIGAAGVGGSSIACAAAHAFLSTLDQLVYVKLSLLTDSLASLSQGFPPETDLPLYCANRKVLFVLDDFTVRHGDRLAEEMWLFNNAYVLAVSTGLYNAWQGAILEVPPLDEPNAHKFFMSTRGDLPLEAFPAIFQNSAGVPALMIEQALLLRQELPDKSASERHFQAVWRSLNLAQRKVWFIALLLRDEGLALDWLVRLSIATQADVFGLVHQNVLVEAGSGQYQLSPLLEQSNPISPDFSLDDLAKKVLSQRESPDLLRWLVMLRHGLAAHLSLPVLQTLLETLSQSIHKTGLWGHWDVVLETVEPFLGASPYWQLWLDVERARLGRWSGLLADSRRRLIELAQQAGQEGHFDLYARALLELAAVAVYRQEWGAAYDAAEDAEAQFLRLGRQENIWAARLLRARAAVADDPAGTLALLADFPTDSAALASLICEAHLKLGSLAEAITHAQHAVHLTEPDSPAHGRALSLLALVLLAEGNLSDALGYQQQAVNSLALTPDIVGLARAYNNLGALYYHQKDNARAKVIWQEAQRLLLPIQDSAALQAVRVNLRLFEASGDPNLL